MGSSMTAAKIKDKGSRLLEVDQAGTVSPILGLGKILPSIGFDIAPPEFGKFGGKIFLLSQPEAALTGAQSDPVNFR